MSGPEVVPASEAVTVQGCEAVPPMAGKMMALSKKEPTLKPCCKEESSDLNEISMEDRVKQDDEKGELASDKEKPTESQGQGVDDDVAHEQDDDAAHEQGEDTDAPDWLPSDKEVPVNRRRSQSSLILVPLSLVFEFMREFGSRLIPLIILLSLLGAQIGYLLNRGANNLLTTAEEMDFHQPWTHSEPSGYLGETYVRVYEQGHWDYTVKPTFPKLSNYYIGWFWVRQGVTGVLGYATPWFVLFAFHGWSKIKTCFFVSYTPFAVFSIVFTAVNAFLCESQKSAIISTQLAAMIWGGLSMFQALVVIPIVGTRLGLMHIWKSVIFPYLLLNLGLAVLKYAVPIMVTAFESEGLRVAFRLITYVILAETFEGITRILLRYVPLADENQIRPEDKPFGVAPVACLFGYWGRIILNTLKEPTWILVANIGVSAIEIFNRLTVVRRDKLYVKISFWSRRKGADFWANNASGMKRFRCSMIYTKTFTEYLMIGSAAMFYWWSGFVKDKNYGQFVLNISVQVLSETVVNGICGYFEFFREKLPIFDAWQNRNPRWLLMFGAFLLGFNLVAVSLSAENYCALRRLNTEDSVQMAICGF
jgi:hypothetical protein